MSLAADFLPIARSIAARETRTRPWLRDDAIGEAALVLVVAERDHDPGIATFGTQVRLRLPGAVRDLIRREDRRGIRKPRGPSGPPPTFAPMPDGLADRDRAGPDAESILAMLPPNLAELVRLIAFEGLRKDQASARLGIHPITVSRQLRKARRILEGQGIHP